jgi:adenine-specific DNA-methyltransferase
VPHVTLKSIAQNTNLDPIFTKHEPILEEKLATCNAALARVPDAIRRSLAVKLMEKQKAEGRKAITDADQRRWELPPRGGKWEHWQVPFDTDPDYPKDLADAVTEYRKVWRAKMEEVNACIAANAEQEELVDQPEIVKGVLRVSGPFTVEAVQPPEMMLGDVEIISESGVRQQAAALPAGSLLADPESGSELPQSKEGKFGGEPEELEFTFAVREVESRADLEARNIDAYLEQMIRLLRMDGVRFPDNKQMRFTRLEPLRTVEPGLQAEGRWTPEGQTDSDPEGKATVCVAYGPQYGPVTAKMVEDVIRSANRMGYDDLVIAGFSFDGPAQAVIEEAQRPKLRIHAAHIRPDVNPGMNGLLKEQPGSQLFTVFGQPRTRVDGPDGEGQYTVTMEGVDIYNPVDNSITSTGANKVAAWFLDGDYDGRTFCITQAFFPDRTAWGKLSKALENVVDPERFEALSGTVSLPFPAGKHKCVAVKVIDPRGNEVMQVHKL